MQINHGIGFWETLKLDTKSTSTCSCYQPFNRYTYMKLKIQLILVYCIHIVRRSTVGPAGFYSFKIISCGDSLARVGSGVHMGFYFSEIMQLKYSELRFHYDGYEAARKGEGS